MLAETKCIITASQKQKVRHWNQKIQGGHLLKVKNLQLKSSPCWAESKCRASDILQVTGECATASLHKTILGTSQVKPTSYAAGERSVRKHMTVFYPKNSVWLPNTHCFKYSKFESTPGSSNSLSLSSYLSLGQVKKQEDLGQREISVFLNTNSTSLRPKPYAV